jgi:hypothetical protein
MIPVATLAIRVKADDSRVAEEVVVMAGSHMIARLAIKELRRVLDQIDMMPHNQERSDG